jgi:hypothetical protein
VRLTRRRKNYSSGDRGYPPLLPSEDTQMYDIVSLFIGAGYSFGKFTITSLDYTFELYNMMRVMTYFFSCCLGEQINSWKPPSALSFIPLLILSWRLFFRLQLFHPKVLLVWIPITLKSNRENSCYLGVLNTFERRRPLNTVRLHNFMHSHSEALPSLL